MRYAQSTVPVSTILSLFNGLPFEVTVPQNFHDGNVDFAWRHGCVATAPEEGLWDPVGKVTAEDIGDGHRRSHMQPSVRPGVSLNQPARLSPPRAKAAARCPQQVDIVSVWAQPVG